MDSLMLKYKQIQQEKKDVVINYIKANKNSFVGAGYAYLLSIQDQEMDNAFVKKAYENVGDNIKNSFYGIEFKNSLATASKVEVGSTTPNFTVNDVNDKPITLSEFYKGKKLVLIDFWASWCGPCRKENPNVVAAYKQFNDKGFEVIGVSLDEDKTDWMNAIAKDKLVWQQVSDLKGWQSGVAKTYNVTGIPTNFLIDGNGKVIAQNLRGIDLENKLKELLK